MNERIQELATKTGISIEYLTNTKQLATLEAFAKLIVLDCLAVNESTKEQAIEGGWKVDEAMSIAMYVIAEMYDLDD
jgi:hypothetical protein